MHGACSVNGDTASARDKSNKHYIWITTKNQQSSDMCVWYVYGFNEGICLSNYIWTFTSMLVDPLSLSPSH